jgi:lipopolysaccharide export LptBFGC system permease protein LptF
MERTSAVRNEQIDEKSLAELMRQLSEQSNSLAQLEVALAKAEMGEKAKRFGIGAGAFGAAGLLGLYALGCFIAAAVLALATGIDAWLAAVIVGVVLAAVAGVLALVGKGNVERGSPPVPERALASSKRDLDEAKESAKRGAAHG